MNAFISLNKLAYGQATIEERMAIDNGTEFKAHVKVFQNDPYPENISPEAKQEVVGQVDVANSLNNLEQGNNSSPSQGRRSM